MALKIYDTLAPQGNYPAVKAEHVQMPDGTMLDQFNLAPDVVRDSAISLLEPDTYYQFGLVDQLNVELAPKDNGKAHEYIFEFEPTENFVGLTITPEPRWLAEPQYPVGKKCIVSVCMGMAVMGCG